MSTEAITLVLTAVESRSLADHEKTIQRGLSTFYEVGAALLGIRDGRLYRVSHKRFEDYCKERWKMTRQHMNRLIAAGEVASDLEPIGSKMPATESQSRPLAKLPKSKRAEVWDRAVETAPIFNGEPKITAKHVEKVVAKELKPEPLKAFCDHLDQEVPAKLHAVFQAAKQ